MTRDTKVQLVAGIVLLACLCSSVVLAVSLSGEAGRSKLAYTDRVEEGQPAEVSLGIAMGAFRGIFVNFLWMRANDMKEAGKFYEAIELASAITRLQPRFPRVWVFHAWNMAYNISVTTQTREERWAWVNAGISILRDKAIAANPNDMLIHKELGWIFLHKIGGFTDDANPYYKRQLATEWHIVLGPPPERTSADRDRDVVIKRHADWLRIVADAPATLEAVTEAQPLVAPLVARLANDVGLDVRTADPSVKLRVLGLYERHQALERTGRRELFEKTYEARFGHPPNPEITAAGRIFDDPQHAPAWPALLPYLRQRVLVEKYRMEPERMIRYTEKYGPIDWRHHAAHSLYWSAKGVEAGLARFHEQGKRDFDFINTDRIVAQSVQDLYRSGELYFDFLSGVTGRWAFFQGIPNPHFVQTYGDIMEEMRSRSELDQTRGKNARGTTALSGGYENFLRDAVTFFYRRGEVRLAEEWRVKLYTYRHATLNNPYAMDDISMPIGDYVAKELGDRMSSPNVAVAQISAALMGAYASGLLAGDTAMFDSQFRFAATAHKFFFEAQARTTAVNREQFRMEQMDRDFRFVAGGLFYQFVTSLDVQDAERVFDAAPDDLKCFGYGPLMERYKVQLDEEAKLGGRPFDAIFPKPDGWDRFLAELEGMAAEREQRPSDIERK